VQKTRKKVTKMQKRAVRDPSGVFKYSFRGLLSVTYSGSIEVVG